MVGAIMALNEGRFVYTLDDPYIHLTLADRITQGTYGINLDEPVAPSPSALWPLLLAPFGRSIALEWVPLVINVAALFVVVALLDSLLWRGLADLSRGKRAAGTLIGALVLALCANQFGLVFTGLEHSLSALLALAIFVGILNESESGEAPLWISVAIVLAPALRYENLAIALPALAFLAWRGHLVRVLVTAIAMIAPLYAFSSFLLSQGLDKFPAGVLAEGGGAPSGFTGPDTIPLLTACLLLAAGIPGSRGRVHPGVLITVLVAALAQFGLVGLGWFGAASQSYMLVVVLGFAALLHGPLLARLVSPRPILVVPVVLALVGLCYAQIATTVETPLASNNIFEQQYQMYRFRTLVQPVKAAVRDVGFAGFRSEGYTLDLSGLASREVLDVLRTPDKPADWVDALVKKHEIQLVMVPAEWGAQHAGPDWVKIATLSPSRTRVAPTVDTIAFYSVGPGNAERANSVLVDFHRGLPQAQQLLGPDGNPLPRPEPLPEPPPEGEEGALDPNDPNVPFDPNAPPADPNAPAGAAPAPGAAPAAPAGAPAAQAPGTPPVGARRKLPSPSAVAVDRRGGEGG
jgi:hypothetical protein